MIAGPERAAPDARRCTLDGRRLPPRGRVHRRGGRAGAVRAHLVPVVHRTRPAGSTRSRRSTRTTDVLAGLVERSPPTTATGTTLVQRSLITLKALTYAPTGGIVAAPTTSLPEWIGGVRNWDYRYCWLRDATFTLYSLMSGGYTEEAVAWRDWLLRAVAGDPAHLQIMYGAAGERRLTEYEVDWLPATRARRRCGSATPRRASSSSTSTARCSTRCTRPATWASTGGPERVGAAASRSSTSSSPAWQDARRGHLGGPRAAPALHPLQGDGVGGVRPGGEGGRGVRPRRARSTGGARAATRSTARCCEQGFDAERNTFTQYYGSKNLDASVLMIPLVGFLPATDPRVVGTVEAIAARAASTTASCAATTSERRRRRAAARRGRVPPLLVLAGRQPRSAWAGTDEARALFERLARPGQRRRPAVRGVRPGVGPHARQLPAGVHPRVAGEHRRQPLQRHTARAAPGRRHGRVPGRARPGPPATAEPRFSPIR